MTVALACRSVARSHVGLVRQINEDRVFDAPGQGLWAVADGMGGHRGGDLAAQTVVEALRALIAGPVSFASLCAALEDANRRILDRNRAEALDAGATVVAALVGDDVARIAWAGDSRAYLLRGRPRLLTHDHSVVQELVDAGLLTPAGAARHPRANVITRALGIEDAVALDTVAVTLAPGDRLLLCSDGLSRSLDETRAVGGSLDEAAADLLAGALARDGSDNVSLVLVEVG